MPIATQAYAVQTREWAQACDTERRKKHGKNCNENHSRQTENGIDSDKEDDNRYHCDAERRA